MSCKSNLFLLESEFAAINPINLSFIINGMSIVLSPNVSIIKSLLFLQEPFFTGASMSKYNIPIELMQALRKRDTFLLIGHKNPDGDCLSSQLAFGSFLERIGKEVCLLSPGPFDKPEIEHQEKYFQPHVPEDWKYRDPLVVVLDCSTIDRIGYLADEINDFDVAVVDHHNSGMSFGDLQFIRPEAPSVTFLVHKIIEAFNKEPTPEEAKLLFFGIATDTGFFRHLESGSEELFQSVAKLTKCGASPKDAHSEIYGGRTLKSKQLLGQLLFLG